MPSRHLLVTNDFPPKIGGIQNYLWELWRRLDPSTATVYCTPHVGAVAFDAIQKFRIERSPEPVLLPYPWLIQRIRNLADEVDAELILLDPAVPLGMIGPHLDRRYGLILHGAEVTIPGRLPGTSSVLRRVLRQSSLVVAAGSYALEEAERCARQSLSSVIVPPGVDTARFLPPSRDRRLDLRRQRGLDGHHVLVATVTRLVPRKGMHTLVAAAAKLAPDHPELRVVIGGTGREDRRLRRMIEDLRAPVQLAGRLTDSQVVELYQAADAMCMPCNRRWGGLEQEGFGIVFLEAGATGLATIAGRSGGAAEAVADEITGLVVERPDDVDAVAAALRSLVVDPHRRSQMGAAARRRVSADFTYGRLAAGLQDAIDETVRRTSVGPPSSGTTP